MFRKDEELTPSQRGLAVRYVSLYLPWFVCFTGSRRAAFFPLHCCRPPRCAGLGCSLSGVPLSLLPGPLYRVCLLWATWGPPSVISGRLSRTDGLSAVVLALLVTVATTHRTATWQPWLGQRLNPAHGTTQMLLFEGFIQSLSSFALLLKSGLRSGLVFWPSLFQSNTIKEELYSFYL